MVARDVLSYSGKIKLKIKKCEDGIAGYQSGSEIGFNARYWDKYIKRKNYDELAATLWHEVVHYIQEKELSDSWSKRGKMVYRQFIEAEAMSYSNLIAPRSTFESQLYKAILSKSGSLEQAQNRYIAVSTRLRLNADRELAKIDAQTIMREYFSESDWQKSEKTVLKDWQDFYYKYHADIIKYSWNDKGSSDAKLMGKWEDYFFNRYGLKISVKSAISKEVIDRYTLPSGIENTVLIRTSNAEVFDINKWRAFSGKNGAECYVLDMPNMNPDYIYEVFGVLMREGLKANIKYITHSDDFSSRCIVLDNTFENNRKFLCMCQKHGSYRGPIDLPNSKHNYPPVHPRDCKYNQTLDKGQEAIIDVNNMPVLCMGENLITQVSVEKLLTLETISFLNNGGIFVIGRNPHAKGINFPREFYGKYVKGKVLENSDSSVSKFHGYFYMKNGFVYYKDYSSNGTFIRPNKAFESRQMQNVVGGRN